MASKLGWHYSWFLIAILIVFSLSSEFHGINPEWSSGFTLSLAVITAILFFGSLLLHKLAHSIVATSNGLPVKEITLFALGGPDHGILLRSDHQNSPPWLGRSSARGLSGVPLTVIWF